MENRDYYREAQETIAAIVLEKYEKEVDPDHVIILWNSDSMELHRYLGRVNDIGDKLILVTLNEYTQDKPIVIYEPVSED